MDFIMIEHGPERGMLVKDRRGRTGVRMVQAFIGIKRSEVNGQHEFGPGVYDLETENVWVHHDPSHQIICGWRTYLALALVPPSVEATVALPALWEYMDARATVSRHEGERRVVYPPPPDSVARMLGSEMARLAALRTTVPKHETLIDLANGLRGLGLHANAPELAHQIRVGNFNDTPGNREFIRSVHRGRAPRFSIPSMELALPTTPI